MADKYIDFLIFFIAGILLLVGGYRYKPLKEDTDKFDIGKLRLYIAAFLALLGAFLFLLFG